MIIFLRLSAALSAVLFLTSCGTASHLLGRTGGLVNSIVAPLTAPVRGILLADENGAPVPASETPSAHDSAGSPAQR